MIKVIKHTTTCTAFEFFSVFLRFLYLLWRFEGFRFGSLVWFFSLLFFFSRSLPQDKIFCFVDFFLVGFSDFHLEIQ